MKRRQVKKLVVSSVVPTKNSALSKAAHKKAQLLWLDWKLKLGVTIDYPKPESIGADRLANAAAVADLYGCPAIVVDFGTAVTFDVVSEERSYIGGVIAPGLEAMTSGYRSPVFGSIASGRGVRKKMNDLLPTW